MNDNRYSVILQAIIESGRNPREPENIVAVYPWKNRGTRAVKNHLERTSVREIHVPSVRKVYYKT